MNSQILFEINPEVDASVVSDLRSAVRWERIDQLGRIAQYWATVGGFTDSRRLVAWCAILCDNVRHAQIFDVIVHPEYQKRGLGKALIDKAVNRLLGVGIKRIHVEFDPELARFYKSCGFRIVQGGKFDIEY